jgi:hypothetical protein
MTTILEQLAHVQLSSCLLALELAFFKDTTRSFRATPMCNVGKLSVILVRNLS